MRSTLLTTGALAVVATSSLFGLIGQGGAAVASEPTTTHEKGIVVECTGTIRGRDAFVSLYENNTVANTIQVVIGGDDNPVGGSRDTSKDFLDGRDVRGILRVDGTRALVQGTAHRVGQLTAVHEEHDDAGQHITVDGTHRRLATDLTLTWRHATAPLDCGNAFVYNLQVTREPVTE